MVPMRDGVRLYTAIYEPKAIAGATVDALQPGGPELSAKGSGSSTVQPEGMPVILLRTPYPLNPYGKSFSDALKGYMALFARAGYIIVFQNVRGQFMSEGDFINVRPLASLEDAAAPVIDEATDTYDTAEWLLRNCRTNGNIGVKGVSYPGLYATMAALSRHPAIKAVSPQAPVTDWWLGDDAHINGAFQSSMIPFAASFMRPRKRPGIRFPKSLVTIDKDIYDWFLERDVREIFGGLSGKVDFLHESLEHPDYDEFWKRRNPVKYLRNISPAVMVVGGWYDAEDCWGAFETYRKLREQSPDTDLFLVAGPWYHGGWRKPGYENLGDAWFGAGSPEYFLSEIEFPFFEHYLAGRGEAPSKPVIILPSGETRQELMEGRSTDASWEYLDTWPAATAKRMYLGPREKLLDEDPTISGGAAEPLEDFIYVSDPAHPVPYCAETTMRISRDAMASDQRFASRRPDVLSFAGPILREPLKIEGRVTARLRLTITGTDADMVLKIIDIRPDGYHMLVRSGVMPVRYRRSFERGEAATPGEPFDLDIELNDIAHHFMPGHRLMVQIQSSLYPLILMNPQRFVANPALARPDDFRKITIAVRPGSWVQLPIAQ